MSWILLESLGDSWFILRPSACAIGRKIKIRQTQGGINFVTKLNKTILISAFEGCFMNELKKRLGRIEARVGSGEPAPLRTFADFIKWGTEHRAANGGELTPDEEAWLEAEFKTFVDESQKAAR